MDPKALHNATWLPYRSRLVSGLPHGPCEVCDDNLWTPDNPLTKEGERQCQEAYEDWGQPLFEAAELIVVSPMTRALQTAYRIGGLKASDARVLVTPMHLRHFEYESI